MHTGPSLTDHDRRQLDRYIKKLERYARDWPRNRISSMAMFLLMGALAVYLLSNFWSGAKAEYGVVERLDGIAVPSDAPPDLWFVAELRRTAKLLHAHYQIRMIETILGVIGVMLGLGVSSCAALLVFRWREGEVKAVLAKLARWQLEQWDAVEQKT